MVESYVSGKIVVFDDESEMGRMERKKKIVSWEGFSF